MFNRKSPDMKSFLTALALLAGAWAATLSAQNAASLRGLVHEPNGQPAVFANVILHAAADSAMIKAEYTNEAGAYAMLGLPAGQYWIEVSYVGLPTFYSATFALAEGENKEWPLVTLSQAPAELAQVTVTARKPIVEVRPDMTVFNVDAAVNATGNTALEMLRKAPGVIVDNNDNIMLLGKNGVRIYIDGKPSPLSMSDLADFLRNIQASEIEAVEIITSPSARYEAEGNAGIINIRMKKNRSLGTNGNLDLGYNVGIHSNYNGSVGLNHRNKKVNVFGKYSHAEGHNYNFQDFIRIQSDTYFDQNARQRWGYNNHNFRAGADFFLSPKHTLGVLVSGFLSDNESVGNSLTYISNNTTGANLLVLKARSEFANSDENYNANVNYRFDGGDGKILNIDADYARFRNTSVSYQPNTYYDPTETTVLDTRIFGNDAPTDIDLMSLKIDHERPLLGGQLSTGAKVSYVVTDNVFDFYNYVDGTPILDPMRSNQFEYTENVNALYAQYQRQLNEKTSVQAGLRLEHTHSLGELTSMQATDNDRVERDYLNLFPSGGISYMLNPKNSFRLGYSYRIDRPRYENLNPFEFKLDELTFQKGNPFLRPQYTHSAELTHTFNYRYNTTLSYSFINDLMAEITDTLSGNRAFIGQRNVATQRVLSLNLSAPFSLAEWWNVFANATVYNTKNEGKFEEGKVVDIQRTTFAAYMQHTFTLPKGVTFEVSGFYNSPSIWGGNFASKEMWSVDAGLSAKILKGRGRLKVSVSDIFITQRWRGVNQFGDLYMDASGGWESRQLRTSFSYNFGNQEVKEARRRQTGLEDEKNRAGGSN
jgi:outer membrane receptor protein involved in Fe transport